MRAAGPVAALACAVWSGAAGARFHSVEDRAYRYTVDETRTADGAVRRFTAERTIVFHRTVDGYDAVVTLVALDQHLPAGVGGRDLGAMFEAAAGALRGRALRFRLDAAGHIVAVEDANSAIGLIADAIEHAAAPQGGSTARSGHLAALAAPLRAAPPAQKAAMLISILRPVVLPDDADRPAGVRSVALPGRPPLPPSAPLSGTETVARTADGVVTVTVTAAGTTTGPIPNSVPGASLAPVAAPDIQVRKTRTTDAASGILRDSRDTSVVTIAGKPDSHRSVVETIIHIRKPDE